MNTLTTDKFTDRPRTRSRRPAIPDYRRDPAFLRVLARAFDLTALEQSQDSIVGLSPDGLIAYFNQPWIDFAVDNGSPAMVENHRGLRQNYLQAIAEPLRPFYEALLAAAPVTNLPSKAKLHHYECSSARIFREFTMQVFALPKSQGWLIFHSLSTEMPHDLVSHRPHVPDPSLYLQDDGRVRQCAHCRRIQYRQIEHRWDWVPAWVEHPPQAVSLCLCGTCYSHYFHRENRDLRGNTQ